MPPELAEAFARETAELNRRRLRVLVPLMALVHVAHIAFFWVPEAARASLAPEIVRWRSDIVLAHAAMIPFALGLAALAWSGRAAWLLGPLAGAGYLIHAAICTGLDQIVVTNVTAYIGYCIGMAVVLAMQPLVSAVTYAVGAATLVGAMLYLQESSSALRSSLPNCFTLTAVGWAFSWMLQAARRREFLQKRTIERQREELTQLNASLEKRVDEAVAQLQAQVRARSSELSLALAQLAKQRGSELSVHAGTLLGGRFRVGEVIGEGGMGSVWRGVDQSSGAQVAIKVIQATSSQQLDSIRRFIQEAGAAATVGHPAVVHMIHVDVTGDGLLYQVQELVEGETLTLRLRAAWAPELAARLGAVLCEALAAAHAHGVVHRDVKPDNVMLTASAPGLKLLDFGIAKLYDAVALGGETTNAGVILGTPAYMAPEQVAGKQSVGDRADVYAVGIILFRALAARLPFEASSAQEMMMRHALATPPALRTLKPSVPEALARLVDSCLVKDPAARPSAETLARALRAFADGHGAPPLESMRATPDDPTVATPRRRVSPAP